MKQDWEDEKVTLWCRLKKALANLAGSSGVNTTHESHPIVGWNVWDFTTPPSSLTKYGLPGKGVTLSKASSSVQLRQTQKQQTTGGTLPPPSSLLDKSCFEGTLGSTSYVSPRPSWNVWLRCSATIRFPIWHPVLWHPDTGQPSVITDLPHLHVWATENLQHRDGDPGYVVFSNSWLLKKNVKRLR